MALIILGHPNFEKSFANKTIIEELQNQRFGYRSKAYRKDVS